MARRASDEAKSEAGRMIMRSLEDAIEAMKSPGKVEDKFTVRTVDLNLEERSYSADDVRKLRMRLHVSQEIFARLLGVSASTVQAWEQGKGAPQGPLSILLADIEDDPGTWLSRRLKQTTANA